MEREFAMEEGKAGEEAGLDCPDMKFGDKAVRLGFIRKVYTILSVQLSFTVAAIVFFVFYIPHHYCDRDQSLQELQAMGKLGEHPHAMPSAEQAGTPYRTPYTGMGAANWTEEESDEEDIMLKYCGWKFTGDYQWLLWASLALSLATVLPMACVHSMRVTFPINFLLLATFTIAESVIVAMVSMKYETDAVIIAAGLTTVIVFTLTIFAFQTKIDFTMMGGMLICVLMVFLLFGIITIFLPQTRTLRMVWGALGALIFSVYLVYDTQMMMGGDHKYSISPEEYIFAALAIYLDVINIFMYLLRFVGAARSS